MSNLVFVGGGKGGATKTCTSHLLCLGAILSGQPAAYVLTDPRREPMATGRPYSVMDGRDPQTLANIITASRSTGNGWLIIDGGGNRPDFDVTIAAEVGLCLLPFRDTDEDIKPLLLDLKAIPHALAWPAAWPTNKNAADEAKRYIDKVNKEFPLRVIHPPIRYINSAKRLLDEELGNPSTEVRAAARRAFDIMRDVFDTHARKPAIAQNQAA